MLFIENDNNAIIQFLETSSYSRYFFINSRDELSITFTVLEKIYYFVYHSRILRLVKFYM